MEESVDIALQEAIRAHKKGNLQDAERGYQAILRVQPRHPDANHNLGVLAMSVDRPEVALTLFKTAFMILWRTTSCMKM